MSNPDDSSRAQSGPILIGLLFVFIGLALLTDRIGLTGLHVSGRYWPLILIVLGCVRLLTPPDRPGAARASRWTGAWLIYLGFWFFVNEFRVLGLWYDTSWPLLVVWAGVRMMSRAFEHASRRSSPGVEGH